MIFVGTTLSFDSLMYPTGKYTLNLGVTRDRIIVHELLLQTALRRGCIISKCTITEGSRQRMLQVALDPSNAAPLYTSRLVCSINGLVIQPLIWVHRMDHGEVAVHEKGILILP